MSFTVVPDKSVGDFFSEAMWDTSIKDNLNKGVMRPIGDILTSGTPTNQGFTGIPADYAHLMACIYARGDTALTTTSLNVRFNAAVTNYDTQNLVSGGGLGVAAQEGYAVNAIFLGAMPAGSAAANLFGTTWVYIPNYRSALHKMAVSHCSVKWGVAGTQTQVWTASGAWRNTGAITDVVFWPGAGNFVAGSRFTLYGLAV